MSFRNSAVYEHQNIKIQQEGPSQLFLQTNLSSDSPNTEVLSKIAALIASLHENYLIKCQNLEIYRDLTREEEELLTRAGKDSVVHTILAGALAIDSCFKSLQRQEQFIIGNLVRANAGLIANFKKLRKQLANSTKRQQLEAINDSIRLIIQQLQSFPEAKGRQAQLERQLSILQGRGDEQGEEWLRTQQSILTSQLQRENDMLKLAIKEKEGYIQNLQGAIERGSRLDKKEQRKTAHTLRLRMRTEKSSENESQSQASLQQVYEDLARLKEELFQKNNIIIRMNEEFASEMEKYNSVFKRLEEENRALKKYSDMDTVYLLEQLELQVENLRQQKFKDQMLIADIQRKFQGFSFSRNSRVNTQYQEYSNYDPTYNQKSNYHLQQPYPSRQSPLQRPQLHRYPHKFYSPTYGTSRSPYERPSPAFRQESYFPQQTLRSRTRKDQFRNKSRGKYQGLHSSREREPLQVKSTASINLLERVMTKGL